jgi:plastocyanin
LIVSKPALPDLFFPSETPKDRINMRFALASAVLATLVSIASAEDHNVTVGNGGLAFNPTSITAAIGDTVSFVFYPKNHTVTQSTFAVPCKPMSNGVDSSFQAVAANATSAPSFSITVNATTPLWFYCRQTGHCTQGMVFAINPTANKSFETFQATAKASSADGTPPASNTTGSDASGSASGASPSSTASSKPNGALTLGAHAGGLLSVVGFAAGILL